MERTPIQKLDDVLSFLNRDTTWLEVRTRFPDSEIVREDMKTILRKLYRDRYVDRFSGLNLMPADEETGYVNDSRIIRNFEGDLFVAQGGYSALELNRRNLEQLAIAQSKMVRRSYWVNFSIAITTGVAAIYYLTELYWKYHWFH